MVKIIEPSVEILTPLDGEAILRHIESCGRTCYQSYDKQDENSHKRMIAMLIKSGHESVLEHFSITVKMKTSLSVYKDITRHRTGVAFSIESTRYNAYNKGKYGNELTMMRPSNIEYVEQNPHKLRGNTLYEIWLTTMEEIERSYMQMAELGAKPDQMRQILPHSIAAEVCMTANLREWRHIFKLRCAPAAHPDVQEIMKMILVEFHKQIPVVFDDLYQEFIGE